MDSVSDNEFTWVIENFSSLQSEKIYSDLFVIGGCRWCLIAYPNGNIAADSISLYLDVVDSESLPVGWRRHAKVSFTIVNQRSKGLSQVKDLQQWFEQKNRDWGFKEIISLSKLYAKDSGFLVNGQLKIVVAVNVLQVIGKIDVPEEEITQSLKKIMLEDCVESQDLHKETMEVNGFHVLPSQVKSVNRLFEKHPNIATKLSVKNRYLKTGYMTTILTLNETLHQSPNKISKDDLVDAYVALESMTVAGFELDWLKKKLDQVEEKKEKMKAGEIRMQVIEKELKDLKAKLEKEKSEVLAASAPVSLSDDDF